VIYSCAYLTGFNYQLIAFIHISQEKKKIEEKSMKGECVRSWGNKFTPALNCNTSQLITGMFCHQ
jgi:hypothetical protein